MKTGNDADYWRKRYQENQTGWDIGEIATPLKAYVDQLNNKELKILLPGCGSGHEARYLFSKGFTNVYLLDFAAEPLERFHLENPDFPVEQILVEDFFQHHAQYDLVLEQTLFCAINPEMRPAYAQKMAELLQPNGKLVGLLFNRTFDAGPPFGGSKEEYLTYFEPYFSHIAMDVCYNSISQRAGNELFMQLSL